MLFGNLPGQLHREPIGVIQPEHICPCDHPGLIGRMGMDDLLQHMNPLIQSFIEASFFQFHHPVDVLFLVEQFRIARLHLLDHHIDNTV